MLDGSHGITGTLAGRRFPDDLHRRNAVVALQTRRAEAPLAAGKGGEGHHLTGTVAHIPELQIFRVHPEGGIRLHIDLFDPATVDEVIDVGRTPGCSQGVVDIRDGEPLRQRLLVVDLDIELRRIFHPVRAHPHQGGILRCHAEQLVTRCH